MAVLAHELPGNLDRKLLAFLYKSIHELITTTLEDARGGQGVLCNCATVNTGDTGGVFAGFKHVKQAGSAAERRGRCHLRLRKEKEVISAQTAHELGRH